MILIKTKTNRIYFIFITFLIFLYGLNGQKIVTDSFSLTVTIPSKTMKKTHKAMIFLPENYYLCKDSFPVVYLLHGYTGYYNNWYKREPRLQEYASRYNFIIVTPEGTSDSWYIDSPVDTSSMYSSYIGKEVPDWIDSHFKTINRKEARAICGLSMGGHGALTIACDYKDIYGAASSMSGVLDFRPFNKNWNLTDILGVYEKNRDNWYKSSFVGKIDNLTNTNAPALLIDCGIDDKFYAVNKKIHKKLIKRKIPHDFCVRPGGHSWHYWKNSLPYHLMFFNIFFEKTKK